MIPLVLLRRKEPSSTAAWILALVFLPGLGSALFLLFGRERVRLPVQWKREADLAHAAALPAERRASEAMILALPVEDRELFRVGATLEGANPSAGNSATLLVNGDATYDAIGAAIDAAKSHVYAEYYLIRRSKTADWFRERLIAAATRGVAVRLLLDGYGSFWIGRRWIAVLRAAGVEVAFFLPARLILFQPMNLRNHRKIVVVDGEVGFTGGINVGDEYRGVGAPWRDIHMALRGPSVQDLSHVFEQDWHFATKKELPRGVGKEPPQAAGDATVTIVRSGPDMHGPKRETIHRLFFAAITTARSRVYITTPYFIPDRAIIVALQTAALRGVDVKVLLPSKSNHPFVFQAGRAFYEELLEAGVGIYEYGPGMIHAKTMVVDGTIALVGSANMDLRSFRLNFEIHALVRQDAMAAALDEEFATDLAVSTRIDLDRWKARAWTSRVVEGLARLSSPLM